MSKWCVTVMMGALLALPSFAQQRNTGSGDGAAATTETAENAPAKSDAFNVTPVRNIFAMPAVPRPTPFPRAESARDEELGRQVPRYEVALMYQYINFMPGDPFSEFNNHGGTGSFTFNANRWLGLVAEVGGTTFSRSLVPLDGTNHDVGGITTYLFGPRLNLRKFERFVPFAEFLVGGAHAGFGDHRQRFAIFLCAGGGRWSGPGAVEECGLARGRTRLPDDQFFRSGIGSRQPAE